MKDKITLLFLLFISLFSWSQTVEDDVYLGDWVEPDFTTSILEPQECRTIRVVVHVVWDGMQTEFQKTDIRREQVLSAIRTANMVFRNDSLYYHPSNNGLEYRVELATEDPDGAFTDGIIYYDGVELFGETWHERGLKNSGSSGVSASQLSSEIGWGVDVNGKKYLNCYVVPKIDGSSGGGVQAFAYFPTQNQVFGNYILYNAFGSKRFLDEYGGVFQLKTYTNLGLVWVHELLHNFAIFHTFQGNSCGDETNCAIQGDRVCDTDPQTKGFGCSGSCGFLSENIMDYISEGCKNRITEGQATRADLAIQNSLTKYLVCDVCQPSEDGDFNGDGFVNIIDASLMNTVFNCVQGDECYNSLFDLNCDGGINVVDVSIFQSMYPQSNVPNSIISPNVQLDIMGRFINPEYSGIYLNKGKNVFIRD